MDRIDTKVGLVFHIISQVDWKKKKNRLHACLQCDIRNEHWDSFLEIQFYTFCSKRILRKRTCSPPFLLLWFQNFEMYTFFFAPFRPSIFFLFFYTFSCFFYPILFKNFHQKLVACKSFFPHYPTFSLLFPWKSNLTGIMKIMRGWFSQRSEKKEVTGG